MSKAKIATIGVLGAAFITGIFTVMSAVITSGGDKDNGKAPPTVSSSASAPRSEASRSQGSSSSAAPAPAASLESASNAIQYTGSVRIASAGPDLDSVPPETVGYFNDISLGLVDPPRLSSDIGTQNLALWPDSVMPTRQQCSDLVSTQGVRRVTVKKGTVICVRTNDERIAVLTVTSASNDFNTGVMAQATVWSEVSDEN